MKLFYLVLLTIISLPILAHDPIDSLLTELTAVRDTARVTMLNQLGEAYRYLDTEQANRYLDSALRLAEKLNFARGQADAHRLLGGNLIVLGDTEGAIRHTQLALTLFRNLEHEPAVADVTKNLGLLAYYQGDYKIAKNYYQQALDIFLRIADIRGQAKCYANMGIMQITQGEYDQALSYFLKSLNCNELLNDQEGIASDYVYMAQVYQLNQNLTQALEYQKKALHLFTLTNNQVRKSLLLSEIGNTYFQQKAWEKAIDYHLKALELQRTLGSEREIVSTLNNLGTVYEKLQQYDQAQKYYRQSLSLAQKLGKKGDLPTLLINVAELALKRESYDSADYYLDQTITLAKNLGHKNDLQYAYRLMYQVYEAQGNYREALRYYQISRDYQDSLFNEEKSEQIAELQTRYEVEKKEQKIEAQEQDIAILAHTQQVEARLRLALLIALGLLFLLILFVYSRYRLKRKTARALDEKNQQIQTKNEQIRQMNQELEKRMLRAQMDPHFIFNSLNSIQHFITINDKTSALKYLSKFSKLVRRVLESSVNTQVPLSDEITLLKLYIELERLRYSHPFDYVLEVDESVDVHDTEIPFLLIQPYVENALVHGLRHREEGGRLRIEIKRESSYLICVVEDNGIGRAEAQRRKQRSAFPSRGMSVTQQRLETLNQGKEAKTSVRILDQVDEQGNPAGTRVEILVPQTQELCLAPSL